MNNIANDEVLDKLTKVCICKSISRKTIKDAIENGASTVEEVMEITKAGTGACKGHRCIPKIKELLEEANK